MKIGLLTQWYAPEPGPASLPTGLAEGLAARGHEVTVLTGFPNYPHGRIAEGWKQQRRLDSQVNGVHVRRVALYPNHDQSALRRVANYASFAASARMSGLDAMADVDALWVNYSPVTVAWPMLALHRRGIPSVVHVLDLWPDTVLASGLGGGVGRIAERPLTALCDRMYDAGSVVAYISPGVGDVLASRGVPRDKLAYAPMWADEQVHQPQPRATARGWDVADDTLTVAYAGTLGGAQDLETLIDACARVTDLDLMCLVAGSGTHEDELRERARRVGASNVRFVGRLDADGMARLNATADVHYVGLNDHPLAATTMPSKVQAVLASGRPIVGALVGDAADVVRQSGGAAVAPGDVDGLARHLRELSGQGREEAARRGVLARDFYEREFSFDTGASRVEDLLVKAAGGGRRG
ncbi:glycosyltransferase family 4 protein [Nocardioides sp. Y6]|uniref:Glycosyltransferase family 4 protein n=1 Tax=Nocardioides malaquae TaxID=2773426 RepID=A0ABR9RTA7_9ACTN|nr:glycosyltransferase family 4 protein [Nocardioides malaquae]MBE7324820.1 glycosyltransferase family 4 protein [Nocardioides malaquae]